MTAPPDPALPAGRPFAFAPVGGPAATLPAADEPDHIAVPLVVGLAVWLREPLDAPDLRGRVNARLDRLYTPPAPAAPPEPAE